MLAGMAQSSHLKLQAGGGESELEVVPKSSETPPPPHDTVLGTSLLLPCQGVVGDQHTAD